MVVVAAVLDALLIGCQLTMKVQITMKSVGCRSSGEAWIAYPWLSCISCLFILFQSKMRNVVELSCRARRSHQHVKWISFRMQYSESKAE